MSELGKLTQTRLAATATMVECETANWVTGVAQSPSRTRRLALGGRVCPGVPAGLVGSGMEQRSMLDATNFTVIDSRRGRRGFQRTSMSHNRQPNCIPQKGEKIPFNSSFRRRYGCGSNQLRGSL